MARSRGTSIRKSPSGQLEWTMAKKKKPAWRLTSTGKTIEAGKKAARWIIAKANQEPEWRASNGALVGFCFAFLRRPEQGLPSIQTPQFAHQIMQARGRIIRGEKAAKQKGQKEFDFGSAELPF